MARDDDCELRCYWYSQFYSLFCCREERPAKRSFVGTFPLSLPVCVCVFARLRVFCKDPAFGMKLYNDQRNAQVFNFISLFPSASHVSGFLLAHLQRQVYNFGSGSNLLGMVSAPGC
jgi:hypothetical protein